MSKKLISLLVLTILLGSISLTALAADDDIVIGFSMDNLRLERWQRDRNIFVNTAIKLGAKVKIQSANGKDMVQLSQAENLITQGVDVLVVLPHNGKVMGGVVETAHENGVPVIAYDRLLMDCKVDYYISFDNIGVGELQAQYLVDRKPEGKYFLLGGSPTDNNADMFRKGQMNVLQPYIDEGKIEIVGDQWCKDWLPSEGMKHAENALTANNNNIDAIVASNDSTAGGAIQALAAQNLVGKVLISGQDATLAGCRRIVEGTQSMTVYKPIQKEASRAAEVAVSLAKGKEIETDDTINNGLIDVSAVFLEPISVDKENMVETIIADGYHSMAQVYKNIPKDEWPEKPAK